MKLRGHRHPLGVKIHPLVPLRVFELKMTIESVILLPSRVLWCYNARIHAERNNFSGNISTSWRKNEHTRHPQREFWVP